MSVTNLDEVLARLGLSDPVAGPAFTVPPPSCSDHAEGKEGVAFAQATATLDAITRGEVKPFAFRPLGIHELEEVGLELMRHPENPHILRLRSMAPDRELRAVPESAAVCAEGPDALVDMGRLEPPLAILGSDGVGALVLAGHPPEWRLLVPRLVVPPIPRVTSPAERWLEDLEDPWLAGEVRARLDVADPLEHAMAVGMLARLTPTPAEGAAPMVERLLAGQPEPALLRERIWARELSPSQRKGVIDLAVAATELLEDSLLELVDSPAPDDEEWVALFLGLLHRRDDIEGVRVLFADIEAAEPLCSALRRLDDEARDVVASLPQWEDALCDERLRRAAGVSPEGWWVLPGLDPSVLGEEDERWT